MARDHQVLAERSGAQKRLGHGENRCASPRGPSKCLLRSHSCFICVLAQGGYCTYCLWTDVNSNESTNQRCFLEEMMQISEAVVAGRALLSLSLGTISKAVDTMLAVSASLLLLASCKAGCIPQNLRARLKLCGQHEHAACTSF